MSLPLKKLKNPKRTQVVVGDFVLNELVDKGVLNGLKKKFNFDGEVVTATIQFYIVSKKGKDIKSVDSITLEHPSHNHFENKTAVITANKNIVLEKFLK